MQAIAVVHERDHSQWWVSDLPGHDGLKPSRTQVNADWGYSGSKSHAIPLSPYWQRRFAKYCRDTNRQYSLFEFRAEAY